MDRGLPSSWLVAGPGLEVVASDGVAVGTVRHVLAAPEEDIFDGLVVDLASRRHGFVDSEDVDEFYEHAVVLRLDSAECQHLPEPQPAPGGLTATGDTPPPGALQRKLHRAWDLLSGKG
jgi:hypothetical protein